jgi:hypothetical protein
VGLELPVEFDGKLTLDEEIVRGDIIWASALCLIPDAEKELAPPFEAETCAVDEAKFGTALWVLLNKGFDRGASWK